MATFIVRFVDERARSFHGRVRHVASGEESAFADAHGLLAFFERMNVLGAVSRVHDGLVELQRFQPAGRPETDPATREGEEAE